MMRLFTMATKRKYRSIDRGMDKEAAAHTYNGAVLSHKKESNAICNMDGWP